MIFKIQPRTKIKYCIVFGIILIIFLCINWKILVNPFMILMYLIVSIKLIKGRGGHYKIENNKLIISFHNDSREINIDEINQLLIIHNYTPSSRGGRGGIGRSYYIIKKGEKIAISTSYKNNEGCNVINYLNMNYNKVINTEVNISNKYK